jgi:hypothetical protein
MVQLGVDGFRAVFFLIGVPFQIVYFEKIRVFKAGVTSLEYISMG